MVGRCHEYSNGGYNMVGRYYWYIHGAFIYWEEITGTEMVI